LDLSVGEVDAWHQLALNAVEPNPFVAPGNLLPAARHLDGSSSLVLAFVADNERMYAALPVRRKLSVAGFRVLSARPFEIVNLGTPLLAKDAPAGTMAALLAVIARYRRVNALALEWMSLGGPVEAAVQEAAAELGMPCHCYRRWDRPVLSRASAAEALAIPKHASQQGRWRRLVARETGHEPALVDRSGDPEWAERFLRLESAGWKGRQPDGKGALNGRPGHADWFRASALELTRSGLGHLLSLEAGSQVLAMNYVLDIPGQGLFGYNMCYDEAFRACGPGVQLLLETVKFFVAGTEDQFLDSCATPENAHIPKYFHETRPIGNLVIGTGWLTDRWAVATAPLAAPLVRSVRRRVAREPRSEALARPGARTP
jgi:hypothetical protein